MIKTITTTNNESTILEMTYCDFKDDLWRAFSKIADISNPDIYDTCVAIIHSIITCLREEQTLDNYFEFIAAGAFKECYKLGEKLFPWVIKLASAANGTLDEKVLIEEANRRGLDVFPTTIFIHIPGFIPMGPIKDGADWFDFNTYLTAYGDQSTSWIEKTPNSCPAIFGEYIIIQQKCTPISEIWGLGDHPTNESYLCKDGYEWFGKDINKSGIHSIFWLKQYLQDHSPENFNNLLYFIDECKITDLRRTNIGICYDGRPVIMDCLSHMK